METHRQKLSEVIIPVLEHFKAKIYAISSDLHQLQFIKLNHFKQEIF